MSSTSRPTFLCVPGSWLPPTIYDGAIAKLRAAGYTAQSTPLPSTGADPPHVDFTGDVQGIRAAVAKLVEGEGKDVVLVLHSYSGMPGQEAVKGLGRIERERNGLKGGVVRLVFVQALALVEGFCLTKPPGGGEAKFPEWMRVDQEASFPSILPVYHTMRLRRDGKGIVTVTPQDAKEIFFHDLSPTEADAWSTTLQYTSLGPYSSTVGYAGWRDIPSTYVVGKADRSTINGGFVEFMLEAARGEVSTAFDVVEECEGGHCLMVSYPEWLAEVLVRAVGG